MNELCDNIGLEDSFYVNEGKRCQGVKTSLNPLGRDWTRYSRKMNSLFVYTYRGEYVHEN